jgi:predicted nucleic acid-binding protein
VHYYLDALEVPKDFEHISLENMMKENKNKPILRPLSDLTKEIEVNGEKFVPLEKLYPDKHVLFNSKRDKKDILFIETKTEAGASADYKLLIDNQWRFKFSTLKSGYVGNFFVFNQYVINNYSLYQKLLEWHFDIYGLIENGLAIDINTLK